MNVLIVTKSKAFGGTEQFLIHLILYLKKLGCNCSVATSFSDFSKLLVHYQIPVHIIQFTETMIAVKQLKALMTNQFDVVSAHRWAAIVSSVMATRNQSIPVVGTIHSLFQPGTRHTEPNLKGAVHLPSFLEKTQEVITVSDAVKKTLQSYLCEEKKISVIYNGIPDFGLLPKKHNNKIKVGFVGRLSYEKGPDRLLRSVALLRKKKPELDFEVQVVGDGPMKGDLIRLSEELRISDLCEFMGFSDDIPHVMRSLDILTVPSRQEGLGLVILEAMNQEVPTMGYSVGGIPEVIEHGVTGIIVDSNDEFAFSLELEKLIYNKALRERMGKEARKNWKKKFEISQCAIKYVEIFEKYQKQ